MLVIDAAAASASRDRQTNAVALVFAEVARVRCLTHDAAGWGPEACVDVRCGCMFASNKCSTVSSTGHQQGARRRYSRVAGLL